MWYPKCFVNNNNFIVLLFNCSIIKFYIQMNKSDIHLLVCHEIFGHLISENILLMIKYTS